MPRRGLLRIICLMAVTAIVVAPMAPATAEQAKPGVSSYAWYWESQKSQAVTDPTSGADVVTIEAPNPFCPTTPAGGAPEEAGACKGGRLPVQVQGSDYETPEMLSAVAFDLALIPLGSEVSSFKATFIEANDEQSEPLNPENKQLQACMIEQFFGDGDAREYDEAPRFTCNDTDPKAKRKEVKFTNEDGDKVDGFAWTFDLTQFAQLWTTGEVPVSGIMINPVQPGADNFDPSTDTNWRVVLMGPATDGGIKTQLVYDPPAIEPIADPAAGLDDSGFGDSSGSDSFGSSGLDSGTAAPASNDAETPAETADPVEVDSQDAVASGPLDPTSGALPAYVWLAILVGLMGFSLVRSVVLEAATGIRSDGVLAQIRRINTERRGVALEDLTSGGTSTPRFAPVIAGLKGLAGKTSGIVSKLPFVNKKG